jgi:murein DD-endopeptidase MepM/ murein hydrolase activator NlpD
VRRALLPLAAIGVTAAAVAAAVAAPAPGDPRATASAIVARIVVPRTAEVRATVIEAPPAASTAGPYAYPADGSVVRIGSASASVAATPGRSSTASSAARALAVSLFGGEIRARSVAARATAVAGPAGAIADSPSSAVEGLVVLGRPVPVKGAVTLPLADWGSLEVLAQTVDSGFEKRRSAVAFATGLRVTLSAEHAGYPAGTLIEVALVDAFASAAAASAVDAPLPDGPLPPRGDGYRETPQRPRGPLEPGASIPGAPAEVVRPIPEVVARFTSGGFVFPLFGPASFGDSFGNFRGDVAGNWHHGEDIVAPLGTPVLAVADGTVFSVGWNDLGGWKLWLRDAIGNEFYFAHMSAYSPLAVDGTKVRAGDVLGFVGDTGDAEGGVTHLHFEIHPVELLAEGYDGVVAPYPFLVAWRRAEDVSFTTGRRYVPATAAPGVGPPRVGAYLLEINDIGETSGLVPGALERALGGSRVTERPGG